MTEQFYDLAFEQLKDGTIHLEQKDYCGESVFIDAHPEQIKFLARRLCGWKPETAEHARDLERKLAVITDRLRSLVFDDWFRKGILEGCGDGLELIARLDGIVDLCVEMDGGRLLPPEPETKQPIAAGATQSDDRSAPQQRSDGASGVQQLGLPV